MKFLAFSAALLCAAPAIASEHGSALPRETSEIKAYHIEHCGDALCAVLFFSTPTTSYYSSGTHQFGLPGLHIAEPCSQAFRRPDLLLRIHNSEAQGIDASVSRAALTALDAALSATKGGTASPAGSALNCRQRPHNGYCTKEGYEECARSNGYGKKTVSARRRSRRSATSISCAKWQKRAGNEVADIPRACAVSRDGSPGGRLVHGLRRAEPPRHLSVQLSKRRLVLRLADVELPPCAFGWLVGGDHMRVLS